MNRFLTAAVLTVGMTAAPAMARVGVYYENTNPNSAIKGTCLYYKSVTPVGFSMVRDGGYREYAAFTAHSSGRDHNHPLLDITVDRYSAVPSNAGFQNLSGYSFEVTVTSVWNPEEFEQTGSMEFVAPSGEHVRAELYRRDTDICEGSSL